MDGLLAHLEFRRREGDSYRLLSSKVVSENVPVLPIKQTRGVYHCSVSILPGEQAMNMQTFYKRFASNYAENSGGRIDRSRGFFKDYVLRTPYICTNSLEFYCALTTGTGKDWLHDLLSGLVGLGREINIGFGWINSFQITEQDEDRGLVDPETSLAMRPIPITMLQEYGDVERLNFRPPYWDRSSSQLCAVPFSKVKLK